jgi:hypothetical protein
LDRRHRLDGCEALGAALIIRPPAPAIVAKLLTSSTRATGRVIAAKIVPSLSSVPGFEAHFGSERECARSASCNPREVGGESGQV